MSALHVVFKVGDVEYAIPASDVLHMESYAGATPVPGTAEYVAGLVQIRGRVVPVIDLRARFGLPPAEPTVDTRVVVGQLGDRSVGLLVDLAREVIRLAPDQIGSPPAVLVEQSRGFVQAVAQVGSRLLMLIDFSRIAGEDQERPHGAQRT